MKKAFKIISILFLVGIICLVAVFTLFSSSIYGANSNISFDKNILLSQTAKTLIFDSRGDLVETASSKSPMVSLGDLPSYVKNAFISIEDKNFYHHDGLNYKRMAKAFITNLTSGYAKEGASTISQQLIKNTYLNNEKTLDRKVKEILLTRKLEKEFSKNDILESYLNVIYFGNSSYGIESASNSYFNKSAAELTLSEAALLAGLIKSPLTYSPIYNLDNSINRRNLVLFEMKKDGVISSAEYEKATQEPLNIIENKEGFTNSRIYEKAVLEEVSNLLKLSEKDVAMSNLRVYTYMDKNLQDECENLVLDPNYYEVNEYGNIADSAITVIDNKTGGIKAFYGKSSYDIKNMKRLPGSAIKPILVYAPALEYGKISPATPILDEKISFSGYEPHNVGGKFYGYVSARETVEKSLNIPAIKILQYVGIDKAKEFSSKAGIHFNENDIGYSIALGGFTSGITLNELTGSYVPFATGGNYVLPSFIKRIETQNGKILYENKEEKTKIMSEETAYLMTDMLISSVKQGTSKKLSTLPFEVAGKTGTVGLHNSNNNSDAWSIAYTPNHTVGVWFGNSTGKKEYQLTPSNNGGTYASMLLRDALSKIEQNNHAKFTVPNDIVFEEIDLIALEEDHTLKLASLEMPAMYKVKEVFHKKYAPKEVSASFERIIAPNLSLRVENGINYLTFEASPYLTYDVFKIEEDYTTKLKTIKNEKGLVTIEDGNLEEDILYEYYLVAKQINPVTGQELKSKESNNVKAVLKLENKVLEEPTSQTKKESTIKKIIKWFN